MRKEVLCVVSVIIGVIPMFAACGSPTRTFVSDSGAGGDDGANTTGGSGGTTSGGSVGKSGAGGGVDTGGAAGASDTGGTGTVDTGGAAGASDTGGAAGVDRGGASGTAGSAAAGGTAGKVNAGGASATAGSTAAGGTAGTIDAGGASAAAGSAAGGKSGSAGAGGAAPTCDTTVNVCAQSAPAGWTGPFAFVHGAGAPPGCPGAYPTPSAINQAGPSVGSSSCACMCGDATGIVCSSGTASIIDAGTGITACEVIVRGKPAVWSAAPGVCTLATMSTMDMDKVSLSLPVPDAMGSCAASPVNTLPAPSFAEQTRTCSGGTTTAVGCTSGQVCAPQAFAPYKLCVSRPGDFACPTGYTQATTTYDGVQDTRACSACSCGAAASTCDGEVDVTNTCTGASRILETTVSGCGTNAISAGWGGTYTPKPSGKCVPSSSTLSGAVTPTGDTTVCCMP
jgi:hypothetical protein